jgi:hypothetical protein
LAVRGNYLTVKLVVLGPGDALYFWWGHIGLLIEDALSGQNRFYDWGVFSFDQDNFYVNFALGRLLYSCYASDRDVNLSLALAADRDITVYTLDIPPELKTEIFLFAENNALPENRDYLYHHFKENCATPILNIIDRGTSGAFRARYGDAPGRLTLREHVRRHTWFSPLMDWLLSFWMGQDIDRPATVWEEMFLPSEIGRNIENFYYTDLHGTERKLVSSVEILNRASGRPPVLEVPRKTWPGALALGVLVAALLVFLRILAKKKRPARILFGLSQAALGLFLGTIGFLLFFMAFFTDHDYTYHNSNLLFINPLLFAALPFGLVYAFTENEKKRRRAGRVTGILWAYVFLGGLLSAVLKLFPSFFQQNQVTLALVLPLSLGLGCIINRMEFFPSGKCIK